MDDETRKILEEQAKAAEEVRRTAAAEQAAIERLEAANKAANDRLRK